ncbi:hypothetical protein KAI46_03255, partial [bacterium]|nr:hypothetical protein [bacterium]
MSLLQSNIKLMASERMHDEDDGGGRMSGNEIIDGVSNNMFPDVSPLDRTYGRLNLRKVFPAVLSDDTDTYAGAHLIVSQPPTDDDVHCTLFRTSFSGDAWVDERVDAQDKIESYITIGPLSPMRLVGGHYEGQRAILAYQLTTDPLPDVGAVLALNDETAELRQYVRITSIDDSLTTYTDDEGQFERTELMIQISDPLQTDFDGGYPSRHSSYQPPTSLHRTNAIPAVSYYGISALAQAVDFGERALQVENYKENLLPATQSEEPLLDIPAGNSRTQTIDAGARDVIISQVTQTATLEITSANRGYTYVFQLMPKPAPGTLEIAFRTMGKWYKLIDESGTGQLSGDGSGSINYTTGSGSVTLAEMPDTDTLIILGWGSGDYFMVASSASVDPPEYRYTVAYTPIKAGSITITWLSGGDTKTLTDNGTGILSGDGTGWVIYADGNVVFTPSILPDPGETPQIAYTQSGETAETFTDIVVDEATGEAEITLTGQPVPGSVQVEYNTFLCTYRDVNRTEILYFPDTQDIVPEVHYNFSDGGIEIIEGLYVYKATPITVKVSDNGAGALPTGSVDYAAKEVIVDTRFPASWSAANYPNWVWYDVDRDTLTTTTTITVKYTITGAAETEHTEDIPHQLLEIDLAPHSIASVVPGSLAFT